MSHRQLFASGETIREQKDEIARLQAEIERLRLTDAERLAIQWVVGDALSVDGVSIQETLRGLLERTAL